RLPDPALLAGGGRGYDRWTPAYFHRQAIELWDIFHYDKPCHGAEFVEVGKRHYVRTLDTQDKVIEVYEVLINGKLARKKKRPPQPFALIQAALGLDFDYWRREIRLTRPCLPDFLDQLRLQDVRLGDKAADLCF